jgi:adenosylcobinamide-phosphate synthase
LLPEFLPSMVPLATSLWILFAAVVLDRMVGDPDWLWRRLRHPVVLFGGAIAWTDRHMNRETDTPSRRRAMGCVAIIALVSVAIAGGLLIVASLRLWGIFGLVLEAVCVAILLAQKSLSDHVGAVSQGLRQGGLAGGRQAVSMIVGRDPETLDAPAVSRAAIESLAENFSDGVVAPVLWYLVFGLPGLFAYKMINTADSMIGHRNERYEDFGKAAARLDDVANWPAARLSAVLPGALLRIGSDAMMRAALVCRRDARLHRSPNAGWPEAAMAGALDLSLAGPRSYGGTVVDDTPINATGRRTAEADDIERALGVYRSACDLLTFALLLAALVLGRFTAFSAL